MHLTAKSPGASLCWKQKPCLSEVQPSALVGCPWEEELASGLRPAHWLHLSVKVTSATWPKTLRFSIERGSLSCIAEMRNYTLLEILILVALKIESLNFKILPRNTKFLGMKCNFGKGEVFCLDDFDLP